MSVLHDGMVHTHGHHWPIYGHQHTICAVQSGNWSDPATWGERIPNADDAVCVPAGIDVRLDGAGECLDLLLDGGTLDASGCDLRVRTLTVLDGSLFKLYDTGRVTFRDLPIDTTFDPEQTGHGLLVLGGTVVVGATKRTWATVAQEIKAGDTSLVLTEAVAWEPGDVLIIPDTNQPTTDFASRLNERVTVASVNGTTVTLTAPVQFDHKGWRTQAGEVSELFDVINLTQPIMFRSENPAGVRAHVLWHAHAYVEICGVSLVGMGRTTFAPIDSTKKDAEGNVVSVGTNQIGRYVLHAHHHVGPPNPTKPYQFRVERVAVDGSPKWGLSIHNSHFGRVSDSVFFNCAGGGIVTEEVLSYGNEIVNNVVVAHQPGSGQRITDRSHRNDPKGDFWHDRVGLGLGSAMNLITGNRMYSCKEGLGMSGFGTTEFWRHKVRGVVIANYKTDPNAEILGDHMGYGENPKRYPFLFDTSGNKLMGCWRGIEVWTADAYPDFPERMFPGISIVHTRHPTDLEDQRETTTYDWRLLGDFALVTVPTGDGSNNTFAIRLKDDYEFGQTHFNIEIRGYDAAYRMVQASEYTRFVRPRIECPVVVYQPRGNFRFGGPWLGEWDDGEYLPVNGDVKFIAGWYPKYDINLWLQPNRPDRKYLPENRYLICPWLDGRDLEVFHHFQSADFALPPLADPTQAYGDFPAGVHTNAELIERGTPIFSRVMPDNAEPFGSEFFFAAPLMTLKERVQDLERRVLVLERE